MFESHCQLQEPPQAVRFAGVFALLGGSKIEPQYSDVDFDPVGKIKSPERKGLPFSPVILRVLTVPVP